MSTDTAMSAKAAEEILALLGRRRMSKSELARRLGVSHTWVTNRLTGDQEIGVNELQRIAVILGVSAGELLPGPTRRYPPARDPLAPHVVATVGTRPVQPPPPPRPDLASPQVRAVRTRPTRPVTPVPV